MKAAGKLFEPVIYEGAGHGFMHAGQQPDAQEANTKAWNDAWKRWMELLSKIKPKSSGSITGEDQLFYCAQRGLPDEDAVNMIVSGFCKDVFKVLPMEFAVEAQALLAISLEGSVG